MPGEDVLGRFLWYDLLTTDPAAAQRFYTEVVGWGTEQWSGSEVPYTMWTTDHGPIGGTLPLPEDARAAGAPPHWLAYIGVPNVDATVRQAESLGARLLRAPVEMAEVGRFAVLADPHGATFAVYTPAEHGGEKQAEPRPGDFSWHELMTTDSAAAFEFYRALFGWESTGELDMGEAGMYRLYGRDGVPYGGMMTQQPVYWGFYALVDSADAAAERARQAGGELLFGPMDVPGGDRVAGLRDPQGALFGVHSRGQAGGLPGDMD